MWLESTWRAEIYCEPKGHKSGHWRQDRRQVVRGREREMGEREERERGVRKFCEIEKG